MCIESKPLRIGDLSGSLSLEKAHPPSFSVPLIGAWHLAMGSCEISSAHVGMRSHVFKVCGVFRNRLLPSSSRRQARTITMTYIILGASWNSHDQQLQKFLIPGVLAFVSLWLLRWALTPSVIHTTHPCYTTWVILCILYIYTYIYIMHFK